MSFHDRIGTGSAGRFTTVAALVLLGGCAGAQRTTAPRDFEQVADVAGLEHAYRWTDERAASFRGLSYAAVDDLSSLRVRRLARQVVAMSKLVQRSRTATALDREMAVRCGTFARTVLAFPGLQPHEELFVEGRACASLLVAIGSGPDPARPLVVQAEQLARRVAGWLSTPYALEARR